MDMTKLLLLNILTSAALGLSACQRSTGTNPVPAPGTTPPPGQAPSQTHADGGWIGSGGELIGDGHNPWFLSNTEEIRYCIKHDPNSFSASQANTAKLIDKAFTYWITEFNRISSFFPQPSYVPMGKHRTKHIPCDGSEDVTFIAGYSKLDEQQRVFLKRPKSLLAVAVRTHYDPVQLRGRGFVFVASDIGPDAYTETTSQVPQPWSRAAILYRVLLHEIGHVFGIPHTDADNGVYYNSETNNGTYIWSIMKEDYPEIILTIYSSAKLHELAEKDVVPPFFGFSESHESCNLSSFARSLLNLSESQKCLKLKTTYKDKGDGKMAEIFAKTAAGESTETLVAIIEGNKEAKTATFRMTSIINVRTTSQQTVLKLPPHYPSNVPGPGFFTVEINSNEITIVAKNKKLPILMRIEPQRIIIQAPDEKGIVSTILD